MSVLISLCASSLLMFVAWLLYLKVNNPAIIDVFWGVNICLIGIVNVFQAGVSLVGLLALALLVCWSLRLSLFLLLTRALKGTRDLRYDEMATNWKNTALGFLGQYLLQGALAWVIALPFFFMQYVTHFGVICVFSCLMILIGLVGESVADAQRLQYIKSKNTGVCQRGLWRYSRHPNYFFECVIWLGFSLLGASSGIGLLSFLSIATLFCIMWYVTIPLTERQSIKHRKGYQNYVYETSCFIPWWPKTMASKA